MFEREGGGGEGGGEKERWHRLSVGNLTTEHGINHRLLACDVIITVANSNAKTDSYTYRQQLPSVKDAKYLKFSTIGLYIRTSTLLSIQKKKKKAHKSLQGKDSGIPTLVNSKSTHTHTQLFSDY